MEWIIWPIVAGPIVFLKNAFSTMSGDTVRRLGNVSSIFPKKGNKIYIQYMDMSYNVRERQYNYVFIFHKKLDFFS